MTEISLAVILTVLAVTLLSAITRRNVVSFLKRPGNGGENRSGPTLLPPDLIMNQLGGKRVVHQHEIYRDQMYRGNEMYGLSVSRPDAGVPGICLYGRGRKDRETGCAYSVSKNALMLGWDEEACVFYGQVTADSAQHHSKVFLEKDGSWKQIRYRHTFDIEDGTTIRIENQVLRFRIDKAPACPGLKTVRQDDSRTIVAAKTIADDFPRIGKRTAQAART